MKPKIIPLILSFFLILLSVECTLEEDKKPSSVENPLISPTGGMYTSAQEIRISCSTEGAIISYTLDGSTPSKSNGIIYAEPFMLSSNTTVRAIAYRSGWITSSVSSASYDITLTVATPVISPVTDIYNPGLYVTISCSTPGAIIKYTMDNSTPSEFHGRIYTTSFRVFSTQTIKAIAYLEGWTSSDIASNFYIIRDAVAQPDISPYSGTYTSTQSVSIDCVTPGATIRYTTDGTRPSETYGKLYNGPFLVSTNMIVSAIAYQSGMAPSSVSSSYYIITGTVTAPEFSLNSGTYSSAQILSMSSSTPGAKIRYTTDGSIPTESYGQLYNQPFIVSSSMTIRALAYLKDWDPSAVSEASYVITGIVAAPEILPESGTYSEAQLVSINCPTSGSTIRYTIDGTVPTETTGTIYTEPFSVTSDTTVQAIAYHSGWVTSSVSSMVYRITGSVADPVISPESGVYTSEQLITIHCDTPDVIIRYTTDNSSPTEFYGMIYSGSFTVSEDTTVRAIAYLADWETSNETSAVFVITGTVADPIFSPPGGLYTTPQTVSISCATEGATIYYTTDGSVPSVASGTVYSAPFIVSEDTAVQAIAFKPDWGTSGMASSDYVITGTVAMPVISPVTGSYKSAQTISITCSTPGATIRYTTDGSFPSETTGNIYTGSFIIPTETTLMSVRAIAYLEHWITSRTTASLYTITGAVKEPVFSISSGSYNSPQDVAITCASSGSQIRYTLDGSIPDDTRGTLYTSPITISRDTTINAIAYKPGWNNSSVASAVYAISGGIIIEPANDYNVSIPDMPEAIFRNKSVTITALASHNVDTLDWYVDGVLEQTGPSTKFEFGTGLTLGSHNVTVVVTSGDVQYSITEDFKVIVSHSIDLINFEDGTIPSGFDPDTNWTIVEGGANTSAYSIKAEEIGWNSSSALYSIIPLPGASYIKVAFDRKIHSCSYWRMVFYINDIPVSPEFHGDQDWASSEYIFDISMMPEIQLEWRFFILEHITCSGENCAWIDNISIELR